MHQGIPKLADKPEPAMIILPETLAALQQAQRAQDSNAMRRTLLPEPEVLPQPKALPQSEAPRQESQSSITREAIPELAILQEPTIEEAPELDLQAEIREALTADLDLPGEEEYDQ